MASQMKVYCEPREISLLSNYLADRHIEVVSLNDRGVGPLQLADALVSEGVSVALQIAPQWEWGRHLEHVSMNIMDAGIKLLCGEGAMFRWLGETGRVGTDVGFYLAPWGYSGNSKLAYELPPVTPADIDMARALCADGRRWHPTADDILIIGQNAGDRARYFRGSTSSNAELVEKCCQIWGQERLKYRPHPLDSSSQDVPVEIVNSRLPLREILPNFAACVSANSTATVEAMCAGMPTMNDGVGPWSGSPVVQPIRAEFSSHSFDEYLESIAALLSLHRLPRFDYGDPLARALSFYTDYEPSVFGFDCLSFDDDPVRWQGDYYWQE